MQPVDFLPLERKPAVTPTPGCFLSSDLFSAMGLFCFFSSSIILAKNSAKKAINCSFSNRFQGSTTAFLEQPKHFPNIVVQKVFMVLSLKILHQHWLLGLNTKPGISRGSSMNISQQHLFGATQCPTTNVPHTEPHSVRRRRPMTCGGQCTIQGGALAL